MQDRNRIEIETDTELYVTSQSVPIEVLSELGRATTVYCGAPPDLLEHAQQQYEEALRKFNALQQMARK